MDKPAYKGEDGHYYPGFGLAQWTGPRGKQLHDYEKTSGKAWYTLGNQMQFIADELKSKYSGYYNKAKSAKNVDQATTDAYHDFEGGTRADWLVGRKQSAGEIYSAYNGKSYTYDDSGDAAAGTSGDSESTSAEQSSGGLYDILSNIFGSLGNIFDIKNGFSINSSSSSSDSSNENSSSSGGNAKGAAAAAAAAENELGYHEQGDNITKFGKWSGCDGLPWCAAFSGWSIAQAFDGKQDSAIKALHNCSNINYCPSLASSFQAANSWYNTPEVGDEVLYAKDGDIYHVGLVTEVDKDKKTFVSVEGNTNDEVTRKEHSSYKDGNVYGFGRPDYTGASAVIAKSNKKGNTISGDDDYSATGSGLLRRGGSSGLLRRIAPSRFAYGALKGQKIFGSGSGLISKSRFRGAGSGVDITKTVTKSLTKLKKNLTGGLANNGTRNMTGIDPILVEELLTAITSLLNSIAANTAPTQQIYDALSEYINYVKGRNNRATEQVPMPTNNNDVDTNFASLVTTLSAIARG